MRWERTLLLCFAHPDDESYLAAGTMARYAADGRTRVVLVTATPGGAATLAPGAPWSRDELPQVRAAELHRAAAALGVHGVHLLWHRDGALGTTDPDLLRRQLVEFIRQYRPQVVISFDPHGENLHPDHIAIGRFTSDAVAAAGDRRWLPEAGRAFAVSRLLWTPPTPVWQMLRNPSGGRLEEWPGVDVVIDTRKWIERKRTALRAHLSQAGGIDALFLGAADADLVLSAEAFRMGWGGPAAGPLYDVFEGLEPAGQKAAVTRSEVPQGSSMRQPS